MPRSIPRPIRRFAAPVAGLLALALLGLAATPAAAQQTLRIAAIVNDDVVSAYDLNNRLSMIIATSNLQDSREIRQRLARRALRSLIDERLKMQEAEKLGIEVSEGELDAAMARIEQANGLQPGQLLDQLQRRGVPKSTLMSQIKAEVAWQKVLAKKVAPQIRISQSEVEDTLAEIEAAKDKPRYQVAEIFLPVDDPEEEAEVRALAERLIQQIRQGAGFQALAQNFSKSASAARGGDLGWIREGQLGSKLDKVLRRLEPGQLSEPIRTLTGFHILMLRNKKTGDAPDPGETRVELHQLFLPLPQQADRQKVAEAKGRAQRLAAPADSCPALEKIGKQAGQSAMSGSLGEVQLKDLPKDLREVVAGLPLNRPSPPQRTDQGITVLMVCDRKAPPKVEPPTREEIEAQLKNEQLAIRARRYIRDLRRSAIVDIRL